MKAYIGICASGPIYAPVKCFVRKIASHLKAPIEEDHTGILVTLTQGTVSVYLDVILDGGTCMSTVHYLTMPMFLPKYDDDFKDYAHHIREKLIDQIGQFVIDEIKKSLP